MKKTFFILLALIFVLSSFTHAQDSETATQFEEQTEGSPLEIVRDWRVLAVMALMASVILVAIAYAVGIGFEMPEIQAWAGNELTQVIANAIIIISLIVTIVFIDALVTAMIVGSDMNIPECMGAGEPGVSCLQGVANAYLVDYVDAARGEARNILKENVKTFNTANTRYGFYCTTILCAQVGMMTTFSAHYLLDSDMYTILFEYYINLLAFMESQLFFVNEICFKIGPILLAMGIVARSFFTTRKLGGLLIAIAAGLMFFFPGMYVFDWLTLDMVVSGDKGLDTADSLCPAECKEGYPMAYEQGGEKLYDMTSIYLKFAEGDKQKAADIIEGEVEWVMASNGSEEEGYLTVYLPIYSCNYGDAVNCPTACRELPYPVTTLCIDQEVQEACAKLPEKCKVIRYVQEIDADENELCPDSCKVVPPLKSDCSMDEDGDPTRCLESSYDCRGAMIDDLSWRPTADDPAKAARCNLASQCPASLEAEESCVYVLPVTGRCNDPDICGACPPHCRVENANLEFLADDCFDEEGEFLAACQEVCHESCKVDIAYLREIELPLLQCRHCKAEKRLIGAELPEEYTTGDCSFEMCSAEYRGQIPRNTCEACLFTEESYAYNPPINTQCADLCRPSDKTPVKDAAEYAKIGEEGLVGKADIQSLSKFMLPVYLLPLFNIVATLVFIKGLSTILGGDIEIPGISKVF